LDLAPPLLDVVCGYRVGLKTISESVSLLDQSAWDALDGDYRVPNGQDQGRDKARLACPMGTHYSYPQHPLSLTADRATDAV
jgi:hypothetical protein